MRCFNTGPPAGAYHRAARCADLPAWAAAAAIATSPQRRPRLPQKLPSDILTSQSKGHLNLVATHEPDTGKD